MRKLAAKTKRCSKCRKVKALSEFHNFYRSADGKQYYCKVCLNGRNSETNYERSISSLYGVSKEQYDEMLRRQKGRCAICHLKPTKKRLSVDHDHETGQVRGLLCDRCNLGLAWFEWFQKNRADLATYLRGNL